MWSHLRRHTSAAGDDQCHSFCSMFDIIIGLTLIFKRSRLYVLELVFLCVFDCFLMQSITWLKSAPKWNVNVKLFPSLCSDILLLILASCACDAVCGYTSLCIAFVKMMLICDDTLCCFTDQESTSVSTGMFML